MHVKIHLLCGWVIFDIVKIIKNYFGHRLPIDSGNCLRVYLRGCLWNGLRLCLRCWSGISQSRAGFCLGLCALCLRRYLCWSIQEWLAGFGCPILHRSWSKRSRLGWTGSFWAFLLPLSCPLRRCPWRIHFSSCKCHFHVSYRCEDYPCIDLVRFHLCPYTQFRPREARQNPTILSKWVWNCLEYRSFWVYPVHALHYSSIGRCTNHC